MIEYELYEHRQLEEYFRWFHNQTHPEVVQCLFSELTMFLSREVNSLYAALNYKEIEPLQIDYGFLSNWDLSLTARIPDANPYHQALLNGDYIPERQRRTSL